MMMRALAEGGLDAAFNPNRDRMNKQYGDEYYKPNGPGFYELSREQYQHIDFPKQYKGQLIKCLWGGITKIIPGNYKIVFMRRHIEESYQSHDAFFGNKPRMTQEEIVKRLEYAEGIMRERRDCQVERVWYRDVVENPYDMFNMLKKKGWEIDPYKAAEIVDPELCRFRLENLEVGI